MTEDLVLKKVQNALKNFFKNECDLFGIGVNERSISHKVAEYLQYEFSDIKVDCEYNRHGLRADPKNLNGKRIFPDIVVHRRGTDIENLLVIEVKKNGRSQSALDHDKWKLEELTKRKGEFRYQLGLLLEFHVKNKKIHKIRLFENGQESFGYLSFKELTCGK